MGVFALLGLAGLTAAFWGFPGSAQKAPAGVQAEFLKAVHECDFQAAKSLSEDYGFGMRFARMANEEAFNLRCEMRQAIESGDYEKAVELRGQLREKTRDFKPEECGSGNCRGKFKGGLRRVGGNCRGNAPQE